MKYDFEVKGDIGYGYGSKGWVGMKLEEYKGKPVTVRVNSLGGSVDHALDIASRFRDHGNVTCVMTGMCASAATILAMGAKTIVMEADGLMLIHNCLNVVWELGWMNANEINEAIERMRKQSEDQANIDRVIATMYANKCGKDKDELKKVMDRGTWLNAEECLEIGLIDEIKTTGTNHKAMVAARADFKDLQMAYGLPALPDMTIAQKVVDTAMTINENMKYFFNKVLALLGIEAIACADGAEATAEQMTLALDGATKAIDELKQAKETAESALAEAQKTITEKEDAIKAAEKAQADAIEAAVNAKAAEMQKLIDEKQAEIDAKVAQIEALQAAPGAQQQEPAATGAEPQQKEEELTAFDLYEAVKDLI